MGRQLYLRSLTEEERERLHEMSRGRIAPSQEVERAKMVLWVHEGQSAAEVAEALGRHRETVYRRLRRFDGEGVAALEDKPRSGCPLVYGEEERGRMIATACTHRQELGLPYGHWALTRLVEYVHKELGIGISRAQLARVLRAEGLRWYQERTYFTKRPGPEFAGKRGA